MTDYRKIYDELPDLLYKYRCWSDKYHRRVLTHNEIFFASARHFNDPFDCRVPIRMIEATLKGATESFYAYSAKKGLTANRAERRAEARERAKTYLRKYRDPQTRAAMEREFQESVFSDFGVFSLARSPSNILLWSHYADSHRGFCVGFDPRKLVSFAEERCPIEQRAGLGVFPVMYQVAIPQLSMANCESHDQRMEVLEQSLTVKSKDWEYEDEYRVIAIKATDFPLVLTEGIIRQVILGAEMPEEDRKEITDLFRGGYRGIALFQAERMKDRFGLEVRAAPV